MSKTGGVTSVAPAEVTDRFGRDGLRYYLLRAIPFGRDGTFSLEGLQQVYETELANELGNLINRVWRMVESYCDGQVPAVPSAPAPFADEFAQAREGLDAAMEQLHLRRAIEAGWATVRALNQYVETTAPWLLAKQDDAGEELAAVLYHCLAGLAEASRLLSPFLPDTTSRLLDALPHTAGVASDAGLRPTPGGSLGELGILFPKGD